MQNRLYDIVKLRLIPNRLLIYKEITSTIQDKRQIVLESNKLTLGDITMKFCYKIFGLKPSAGFPLFIGLHGGGGVDPSTNEQQWENHKNLYNIECGIWFTPRGPEDGWNMWHKEYIDDFLDFFIQTFIMLEWVDPNRVFLTGYSAGGDGVYKLGPRMADRFAGCAMMAGHPGNTDLVNVRNLFFALQVGANDSLYDRN